MLNRITNLANQTRTRVVDAVSNVDLNSVKGQLSTTVTSAQEIAREQGERLKSMTGASNADAYDLAVDNLIEVAATVESIDDDDFEGLALAAEALKKDNPFR